MILRGRYNGAFSHSLGGKRRFTPSDRAPAAYCPDLAALFAGKAAEAHRMSGRLGSSVAWRARRVRANIREAGPTTACLGSCTTAGHHGPRFINRSLYLDALPYQTGPAHTGEDPNMRFKLMAAACLAAILGTAVAQAQEVVTIYSADGLHDGSPNW